MIGLDSYSRQVFYLFGPHFDLYQSLNRLPIWNSQNCSMLPLAFVAGWLQGHWWGFISRNYVVWPTFLIMNVFIALKGSHFWFLWVNIIWASSWDYGTNHIGDQRRLRRACASAQSRQSLRCSHTWSMEVDEGPTKKQTFSPTEWLRMRAWRMSLRRAKSAIISWAGSFRKKLSKQSHRTYILSVNRQLQTNVVREYGTPLTCRYLEFQVLNYG